MSIGDTVVLSHRAPVTGVKTNGAAANGAVANGRANRSARPPVKGAYVTLLTKPCYLQGLLVLQRTFQQVKTIYPLIVMATPALSASSRSIIEQAGIRIIDVQSLKPVDGRHTLAGHDARFEDTWTKLRAWELLEFDRVVLLDCDMLIRRNMDELFTMPLPNNWISAVHACACNPRKLPHYPKDWIPENCAYTPLCHPTALTHPTIITDTSPRPYNLLNSGLVILHPSLSSMEEIKHFIATSDEVPTFKFPDQDALASIYKGRWQPLPWVYNGLKTLRKIHDPLWRDAEVKNVHYILDKPWDARPSATASWPVTGTTYAEEHAWWWNEYDELIEEMKRKAGSGWEEVDAWVAH